MEAGEEPGGPPCPEGPGAVTHTAPRRRGAPPPVLQASGWEHPQQFSSWALVPLVGLEKELENNLETSALGEGSIVAEANAVGRSVCLHMAQSRSRQQIASYQRRGRLIPAFQAGIEKAATQ